MTFLPTQAQDISMHTWKDRVLVLISEQEDNISYQQQVQALLKEENELKERKLVVYHVFPKKSWKGLNKPSKSHISTDLYEQFSSAESSFSVILIGLDGGIKLKKSEILECRDLFGIIDGMPMRRAELRRKKP